MLQFKYFHYRDADNRPMATQCFIYNEEKTLMAVGTALCSLRDNPEKKIGRYLSRDRALLALGDHQDGKEWCTEYFKGPYFYGIIDSVKHSPLDCLEYKSFISEAIYV